MNSCKRCVASVLFLSTVILASVAQAESNWPDWRGPSGDGQSDATGLPLEWSESKNIVWKTPIHDYGYSSPVVWGDQIWLTTATKKGETLYAVCIDLETGKAVHDIKVFEQTGKLQRINPKNSFATPSAILEAGRTYVHYGTFGTACIDSKTGKVLWRRTDINCDHMQGPASSPVLSGDLLILHYEGIDVQFIAALDKKTGKNVWRYDRPAELYANLKPLVFRKAYHTPLIVNIDGKPQMLSNGAQLATGHDPQTGKELWRVVYKDDNTISRIISGHGLLFINTGGSKSSVQLWAVRQGGSGDITRSHIAWKFKGDVPIQSSPVLVGDLLYMHSNEGVLTCLEAKTGKKVWSEKLKEDHGASPLHADGRIYLFGKKGKTTVIKPGRKFQKLTENQLDGGFFASPAVAGKSLLLRTQTHLYRIQQKTSAPSPPGQKGPRGPEGNSKAEELNVPPKGFTALFNGKDLTGWKVPAKIKDVWSVENGVLKARDPLKQWVPNIETVKTYRDFVLLIDYRMSTISDSGIYIRGLVPALKMGPREQINLGAGRMGHPLSFHYLTPEIKLKETQLPDIKHIRPEIGRWHRVKITLIGKTLSIKVDDKVVLSEFEYPEGMLSMKPSPIGLQKHAREEVDGKMSDMPIEFRNVFIKEIKPSRPNVPPEGFTALFNGKNFNGWRLSPMVKDAWSIEDGALKSHRVIKDWGADLRTVKKYRDYVLMVDYRIPTISDSGIYIRGLMPGIGIFDRDRWEQFNLRSRGGTGTLESFRFQPPDKLTEHPKVKHIDPEVGVWHTVKLTLIGKTLSAEYDGEVIIDKYEYPEGILSMEPSVIRLQKHPPAEIRGEKSDCPIEFRNVFIKEIKPSGFPKAIKLPKLNAPPRGYTALFNGKDFTGWRLTPKVKEAWIIEGGVLKSHEEIKEWGAGLVTQKKYRNFVLLVDFKFPSISDSGIWFRGVPGIMGGMEQFNLMSVYGTGNLDSLDHLPKDVQLSFRKSAYTPFFYCQPPYYGLKNPPVKYVDPQVGVWHTVKLTLIGRTLSAEYDGQIMHDRFQYPKGTISTEPQVIRLQKHIPQRIAGKLYKECPIEFRNIFIKEIGPKSPEARAAAGPPKGRDDKSPATELEKLLARIDKNELPKEYIPARHQDYVDRRSAQMTDRQKTLLVRLWTEKRRIDPQMPNRGASFVKIMAYVIDK